MRIFFSVGEPSGDLHGANLIRALKQVDGDVRCMGYGGPKMASAGCDIHFDLTQFAVMWFGEAIWNLRRFWGLYQRARRFMREQRPDAVVLIDYPGFNWWIARAAKEQGVPVFYYGVPQLWAWGGWRIRKMRALVDHVLCKLPFEADWYRARGCDAQFVGHPYFDELRGHQLDQEFIQGLQERHQGRPLVCILPGSRRMEVRNNLPAFLHAVRKIRKSSFKPAFAIASFDDVQAEMARAICQEEGVSVDVFVGRTAELIAASHCCMACSGSVSLELLYHHKPTVIHYRVNRFFKTLAETFLLKVRYITLVNLLASENRFASGPRPFDPNDPSDRAVPFPEYPTCEDKSRQLAEHVLEWLGDSRAYSERVRQLRELAESVVDVGASATAASYIMEAVSQTQTRNLAA